MMRNRRKIVEGTKAVSKLRNFRGQATDSEFSQENLRAEAQLIDASTNSMIAYVNQYLPVKVGDGINGRGITKIDYSEFEGALIQEIYLAK